MKKHDFKGKNVLITGASKGIGRALAIEFARKGANLALSSLPEEDDDLSKVGKEIRDRYGVKSWIFPVDLSKANGPDKLHEAVTNEVGDIYALVNNAGTASYGKVWEIPWEPQLTTLQVNLYAPMRLMYLFLNDMVRSGEGVVFNTSSVAAMQPTPFHTVYGATKAALQSLSQGIRVELKGTGVSVCTLNPSYTDTDILRAEGFPKKLRWFSISGLKTPEWVAKKAIKAFEKGKFIYVPSAWAKFIHLFFVRISPRRLVDAVSQNFLQSSGKRS